MAGDPFQAPIPKAGEILWEAVPAWKWGIPALGAVLGNQDPFSWRRPLFGGYKELWELPVMEKERNQEFLSLSA